MKQLLLLNALLAVLVTPVHAATIKVFATEVLTTAGPGFTQTAGSTTTLTNTEITTIIASDPAKAIYGSDAVNTSSIDLGFGANTIVTGAGADLVVISLWYGETYNFGLQAFAAGDSTTPISNFIYPVIGNSFLSDSDCGITTGIGKCSAVSIDLYGSNLLALEDNIEIDFIRLFIGGGSNNGGSLSAYSNISLIGANYTAVPLPLPAILFSSGLALLGWIGRRKKL